MIGLILLSSLFAVLLGMALYAGDAMWWYLAAIAGFVLVVDAWENRTTHL